MKEEESVPLERRPLSWLIAAFLLSERSEARDEIDRRFPAPAHRSETACLRALGPSDTKEKT